ncbi:MAG: TIM barrel protein [Vicinamibacterales bacterium]|jgi:sugar phosphate isomerase/epimerase|nr:TIM barrel protein [Vicinamibacterales bacterium]
MYTRREFGTLSAMAVGGFALGPRLTAQVPSTVGGVQVGVQTYSFRALPRTPGGDQSEAIIQAMTACGLGDCELWSPMLEPARVGGDAGPEARQRARDELRRWRVETPLAHFEDIRDRFAAAGLTIYGFNYSFNDSFSDEEIDRGFAIARALGAEIITSSATLSAMRRVVPFAERHQMVVAVHNHSNVSDPNEFATMESFAAATALSPTVKVNLDIGHFTAANFDAVAYLREHHASITNLHLKDRRRDQGPNVPWGTGDTPIREVLQLLQREQWPIRAHLEYEHRGTGSPVEEVTRCYDYVKQVLA